MFLKDNFQMVNFMGIKDIFIMMEAILRKYSRMMYLYNIWAFIFEIAKLYNFRFIDWKSSYLKLNIILCINFYFLLNNYNIFSTNLIRIAFQFVSQKLFYFTNFYSSKSFLQIASNFEKIVKICDFSRKRLFFDLIKLNKRN